MLVAIFYYAMKEDKPFFKPLSTIAFVNIIVTGVVFHTMLSDLVVIFVGTSTYVCSNYLCHLLFCCF